jgi:3'(2'), 5'-bisphosphate nucleotidase
MEVAVADRDLSKLSDSALALVVAERASRLLLQLRHGRPAPETPKAIDALRNEADRTSHDLIVSALELVRPDDVILSEEGADPAGRVDADRVWIIDPLDGTREFGEGRPDFAVQIALWERDSDGPFNLSVGVVTIPAQGISRTADLTPELVAPDATRPVRLVVSRTRPPARTEELLAALSLATGRPAERADAGSVGAKVEQVISGRADAYVHDRGFAVWDVAAPAAVAVGAGLFVSDLNGQPLELNTASTQVPGVIVARPELAGVLIEALRA